MRLAIRGMKEECERVQIQQQQVWMLEGMLSRQPSDAAQRPGRSHHINLRTKRSSGIHFHSSDSLSLY